MAVNIGPRIGIEGEAEYRKSMQNIIQQQKTLKSEMEATSSAWDKNTSAEKKATDQKIILNAQIKTQEERVKMLSDMVEKSAQKYGEADTKTLKWKEALNNANTELNKMKDELASIPSDVELLGKKFEETGTKVKSVGEKIGSVGQALTPVSAAAGAMVGGLAALGYKSVTAADDLNTLSKQTGISTEELQKWAYASNLVDVSVETMTGAVRKMKNNMTKDSGAVGAAWTQLGISTTDASGQMRSAEEVFYETLTALSQVGNETERDQLAMAIFGKSADELAGVIDDGGVSLQSYGTEAQNLGLILSEDVLNNLNSVNDTIDQTKAQLDGSFAQLGADVADMLAPAVKKSAEMIKDFSDALKKADPNVVKAAVGVVAVVAAIAPLLIVICKVITSVGTIIGVVGKLIPIIAGINPVTALIVAGIAAVIAIGVELYKNWDYIKAKAAEFAANVSAKWNLLKTTIVNNAKGAMNDAKAAFDRLKTSISTIVDNIKTKVSTTWENIKTKISTTVENIKTKVTNTFDNMKTSIGNKIENIKTTVANKFDNIKDKITKTIETARDNVKDAVDRIKGFFDFDWKLPDIKLPHFSISGEFSLVPPSVPHIDVDWYAKAMRNGMILNGPTIFGAQNGRLMGGGEAGPEVVVGASSLMGMIQGAVSNTYNNGGNNVYVYGAPGQDVKELAKEVADIIDGNIYQEQAVFA